MASLSSDPIEPFISIREWIQWHPSQESETETPNALATTTGDNARARPKESTSTLVLTTAKRTFIDIRILLAAMDNTTSSANPDSAATAAVAGLQTLGPHPLPQAAVDWAMVGTSFSAVHAEGQPWHARWEHWIDSRAPTGSTPAADEGVGQFVQGMIMGPDELCLERWEFDMDGELEGRRADWRRALRIGDRYLPCAVTWNDVESLEVGHEVKHSEVVWKVEEKYCW
jgi:hypothetical protein